MLLNGRLKYYIRYVGLALVLVQNDYICLLALLFVFYFMLDFFYFKLSIGQILFPNLLAA